MKNVLQITIPHTTLKLADFATLETCGNGFNICLQNDFGVYLRVFCKPENENIETANTAEKQKIQATINKDAGFVRFLVDSENV